MRTALFGQALARWRVGSLCILLAVAAHAAAAQNAGARRADPRRPAAAAEVSYPPRLPDGKTVVTDTSERFLEPPSTLHSDVAVAKVPPTVDFLYYPGQTYEGKPWSNWGAGNAANGKYYSAIGDHLAVGAKGTGEHGTGTAFVFEYDPEARRLRQLVDVAELLGLPAGHYTPGKIHTRVDLGRDGWLYYATHRGSVRSTTDEYHYRGDWILRTQPQSGKSEVVIHAPVPDHAIPAGLLDPDRLIFYGATAASADREEDGIWFFAYDVQNRKLLYSGPDGPARAMILARSTGRVYYVPGKQDGALLRFDPAEPGPVKVASSHIGVRAATAETPDGFVYTVSLGQQSADADIWSFNTRTEETRQIGRAAVGSQAYVASIDADPSGRYLYYVPGAHGGGERDGSPVVQFDVRTGRKKVIAFLEPFYTTQHGLTLKGTYSTAIDPAGDKLYITWNISRGTRAWDCCGLTVIHIPETER